MNDHWNVLYQVSFFMWIGNPRWLPPPDIVLTQDHMGIYRNRLFSENTELIEPEIDMNDDWMALYKVTFFILVGNPRWLPVCRLLSKLSHFMLLLRNHWVNWNQTWQECSLDGSLQNYCFFVVAEYSTLLPGPIMWSDWLNFQKSCILKLIRHWLRLPGLGNNNEKLGLPERLSAGIQFRFRNIFHGKISGNHNFIC